MLETERVKVLANIRSFTAQSNLAGQAWSIPGLSKQDILEVLADGFEVIPTWDGEITDVVSGTNESDHGKNSNHFSFHTDGVYYRTIPHYAILYCVQTGDSGGETFFTPSDGVIKALRSEFGNNVVDVMNAVFMEREGRRYSLPLVQVVDGVECLRWSSALYLAPSGSISEINRKQFTKLSEMFLAFMRKSMEKQIRYQHVWRAGDFLVFNNRRCVHGRTQIVDPAGTRHLYRVLFSEAGQQCPREFAPRID